MANLSRGDDSTLPLSQHPTRKGGNLSQESHSDHQASSQSSTAQVDHGHSHVLRFVPNNLQARLEFHQLALMKLKGGLNEHHAQFLVIEGMKLASDSEGFDVGANSSSEDSVADKSKQEDPIYHGYFLISLEFHPTARGAKWVIGKGQFVSPLQIHLRSSLLSFNDCSRCPHESRLDGSYERRLAHSPVLY